ncbi:MAG: glycosyltransferase family 4 protein [Candidatus Eisenbacteria bacterium]|nr:glycosyltransferase family 4 protein [Candidatus Eisenbacteria bacterium]
MNLVVLDSARPAVLGGVERSLADLAGRARRLGHDARAVGRAGSRFAAHCAALGLPTLELPLRNGLDLASAGRLRALFADHRTDAVLGATTRDARLAGLARVGRAGPCVALLMGLPMIRDSWSHRFTYRWFVDALCSPTPWLLEVSERYPFARRLPVAVLPDGVDEALFPPLSGLSTSRAAARAEAGIPAGRAVFASVGHLVARKNLLWVPPLLARLPGGLDWEWWVIGDGPQETEVLASLRTLGLVHRVKMLGHRDDVPRLLLCADALVMPSRAEQLPLAALEARRAGVPHVLISPVGAVEEMRSLGMRVLPADDAAAWLAALESAARAPGGCDPPREWRHGADAAASGRLRFLEELAWLVAGARGAAAGGRA